MGLGIGNGNANLWTPISGGPVVPAYACKTLYSIDLDGLTENGESALNTVPILGAVGTGDFTIALWFKTPDTTGGAVNQKLLITQGSGTDWTIQLRGSDGKAQFTGPWTDVGNYVFTDNTWFHLAYSVDRSGLAKWVVNGVLQDTKNISAETDVFTSAGTLYLGSNSSGNQLFEGNFTEISFWHASLSASNLLELYNNTEGKCYASDFSFSSDLKNYYPCFNPTGTFTNPLVDIVGASPITLNNMNASNVSTDSPL